MLPVQLGPPLPVLLCDAALAAVAREGKVESDLREEICFSTYTRQETRIFPSFQLLFFSAVSIFLPSMY